MIKNPLANARDTEEAGTIPGSRRNSGGENGDPFQYLSWGIPWTEAPGGLQSMEL